LRSGFLQIDGYGASERKSERASEMAKLIGCLQPAEPSKHPKNKNYLNRKILNYIYFYARIFMNLKLIKI
jgi:hypothetical protein